VLLLPGVEGLLADPMPPTELGGWGAALLFFQDPDNLLFAKPAPAHASSSAYFPGGLKLSLDQFLGAGSGWLHRSSGQAEVTNQPKLILDALKQLDRAWLQRAVPILLIFLLSLLFVVSVLDPLVPIVHSSAQEAN